MSTRRVSPDILAAIELFARCEVPLADLCRMMRDESAGFEARR
jgi:hypothetical protein